MLKGARHQINEMIGQSERDLYSPKVVSALFGEMSRTYGFVNLLASLGFTRIWRKVVVTKLKQQNDSLMVDLMTGMGELFASRRRRATDPSFRIQMRRMKISK